jgi:uncharacterized membrane protein (DUF485 family)
MWLLRTLLVPFTTAFLIARGLWNRSCDWGWPMGVRVVAALATLGGVLFLFLWSFVGFQWPPF